MLEKHKVNCSFCTDVPCSKLIFAECNLQTGSNLKAGFKLLARALFKLTPKFIDYYRMHIKSEFWESEFES